MARFVGAVVPIALAACGLFDTSGIGSGSGAASVGGDTTTESTATRGESSSDDGASDTTLYPTSTGVDTTGADTGDDLDTLGPFMPGLPVFELNSASHEIDPTLRGDQLEIVFASDRAGSFGLWRAERESVDDPWEAPQALFDPSRYGEESSPEISHDGLVLTYAGDFGFATTIDLYVSVRESTDSPWEVGVAIEELSGPGSESGAVMSFDLLEMYFCSSAMDNYDLQYTTRPDRDSQWLPATVVEGLDTAGYECGPFLDVSGRWLLFTSDSLGGQGGHDIWVAERDIPYGEVTQAWPLEGVNTSAEEFDGWLSPGLETLWYAGGAASDSELFVAVRD